MRKTTLRAPLALFTLLTSGISPYPGTYSVQRTDPPPTTIVSSARFLTSPEGEDVAYVPAGSTDKYTKLSDGKYHKGDSTLEIDANPSGDPPYTYEYTYPNGSTTSGFLLP